MRERLGRLGAASMVLLVFTAGCTPLDDAMVAIFGRSMRDQASFDPYENPRPPAEGTVPVSSGNFPASRSDVNIGQPEPGDYVLPDYTPRDMLPPGSPAVLSLVNTVPADSASLARGKVLFDRICSTCHGPEGIGAAAKVVEVWPALAAYNLAGPTVQAYPDAYIYGMIRVGRGLMPPYGHQIGHFDRWNIVNYVRQLQAAYNAAQGQGAADGGED